jgi:hypothetical protein
MAYPCFHLTQDFLGRSPYPLPATADARMAIGSGITSTSGKGLGHEPTHFDTALVMGRILVNQGFRRGNKMRRDGGFRKHDHAY